MSLLTDITITSPALLTILLLLAPPTFGQSDGVCYHEGECINSPYIDVTVQPSPIECSQHCDRYDSQHA